MKETFRVRSYYRNLGVIGLGFWLALAVLGIYGLRREDVPPDVAVTILLCVCCSLMVGLSFWMLLAYWKYRLTVDGDRITKVGIFRKKELLLGSVSEVRWRIRPQGGSVVLKSPDVRIKIDFNEYTNEQRDRLVRYLRERLSRIPQVGWTLFAYRITSGETKEREPQEGDVVVDRRRWDRLFLVMTPLFLATGAYLVWQSGRWEMAFAPLVPLAFMWGLMRFSTPRKGIVYEPISKTESAPDQWKGFACLMLSVLFLPLIDKLPVTETIQNYVLGIVFGSWLLAFFFWAYTVDRWQRRRLVEKAEAAALARGERLEPRTIA